MILGRLYDECSGRLERTLLAGRLSVPVPITVRDGRLEYRLGPRWKQVDPDKQNLLTDFLYLSEASDDQIGAFACRWGVLGLCSHWLPYGHPAVRPWMAAWIAAHHRSPDFVDLLRQDGGAAVIDAPCLPAGVSLGPKTVFFEPLQAWRWYARHYRALLERANSIREGEVIPGAAERFAKFRAVLSDVLDDWLAIAPLALRFRHAAGKTPEIGLVPVNPLSALSAMIAAQVALAANGSADLLVCSACHYPYFPPRRPSTGEHSYCTKCGRAAALRDASRRYYAKHRKSILKRRKEQ